VRALRRLLITLLLALALLPAAAAHAVLVRPITGHFLGIAPRHGVSPASLPGALRASGTRSTSNGTLVDNGGPVLHSSAPYLIFWTPPGESIPAGTQSLLERYFADTAADSGASANVYGVNRQYSDSSGFADYSQAFSSATQVLTDYSSYPTANSASCPYVTSTYPHCITDSQLQAEVAHELATVPGLPVDGSMGASSLPADAPIYFVVLPTDVNVCFGADVQTSCAGGGSNGFCAYHSSFTYNHSSVIYAAIPTLIVGPGQNPKACQWDGNAAVQEPNGSPADVVVKYLSHEDNEAVTDPLGTGWYDPTTGNENGDNCNFYGPTAPANGSSPLAFAPTLGGSASGTLYNQLINHDQYYLQSEWSNGDGGCDLRPASATITPAFSTRATSVSGGVALTFDPSASTSTGGYASATWNFGDGTATYFNRLGNTLLPVSHTYTTLGTYTVTLTLVDDLGNVATVSQQVRADEPPIASFDVTASPGSGQPTAFDAGDSADPDGSVVSYSWNFGDGTTGSGATPTHVYAAPGTYSVTLTVTDSDGMVASTSESVPVAGPMASFTAPAGGLIGAALSFDASASSSAPGTTLGYTWSFGDGTSATGPTTSHAYGVAGTYTVTLTVTNDLGQSDSTTRMVSISDELPTAAFTISSGGSTAQPVAFDASAASDPDGTVARYSWQFGDGTTGSGWAPTHLYATAGAYTVTLTVTDSSGLTSAPVSHQVVIHAPPVAAFTVGRALAGKPSRFDASGSSEAELGMPIVVYLWSFGDGRSANGPLVSHTFSRPGRYSVTLTVINGAGQRSSTTTWVTAGARITHVSLRTAARGATLLVAVDGPGRLRLGGRSVLVSRAGTARLGLRLSAHALLALKAGAAVRLHVALSFIPATGSVWREVVTIGFRPRAGRSGRFNAVLVKTV
jgi:PKD repeat protein